MKWRFRRTLKISFKADIFKLICRGQDHLDRILCGQRSGLLNLQRHRPFAQLRLVHTGQNISPQITGAHVAMNQHARDVDACIKHLVALQSIKGDRIF